MSFYQTINFAIECVRKKARECKNVVWRKIRNYKYHNREVLTNLIRVKLVESVFDTAVDPEEKWKIYYDIVLDIMSVMCPYKKYRQREVKTPWITPEIYRNIRYRDLSYSYETTT